MSRNLTLTTTLVQNVFNKEMVPDFAMQDCFPASANSLDKKFKALVLMCYFHVIYNVIKEKIPQEHEDMLLNDIKTLHYSASITEFNENNEKIFYKWSQFKVLDVFLV